MRAAGASQVSCSIAKGNAVQLFPTTKVKWESYASSVTTVYTADIYNNTTAGHDQAAYKDLSRHDNPQQAAKFTDYTVHKYITVMSTVMGKSQIKSDHDVNPRNPDLKNLHLFTNE